MLQLQFLEGLALVGWVPLPLRTLRLVQMEVLALQFLQAVDVVTGLHTDIHEAVLLIEAQRLILLEELLLLTVHHIRALTHKDGVLLGGVFLRNLAILALAHPLHGVPVQRVHVGLRHLRAHRLELPVGELLVQLVVPLAFLHVRRRVEQLLEAGLVHVGLDVTQTEAELCVDVDAGLIEAEVLLLHPQRDGVVATLIVAEVGDNPPQIVFLQVCAGGAFIPHLERLFHVSAVDYPTSVRVEVADDVKTFSGLGTNVFFSDHKVSNVSFVTFSPAKISRFHRPAKDRFSYSFGMGRHTLSRCFFP